MKTAAAAEASTTTTPAVGSGVVRVQAEMVPSSLANRKRAGAVVPPRVMTKSVVGLATRPEGAAGPEAPGRATTSGPGVVGWAIPSPSYRVASPVPLSATHHGVVGSASSPQEFTRLASTCSAATAPSDTRLRCTYAAWPIEP